MSFFTLSLPSLTHYTLICHKKDLFEAFPKKIELVSKYLLFSLVSLKLKCYTIPSWTWFNGELFWTTCFYWHNFRTHFNVFFPLFFNLIFILFLKDAFWFFDCQFGFFGLEGYSESYSCYGDVVEFGKSPSRINGWLCRPLLPKIITLIKYSFRVNPVLVALSVCLAIRTFSSTYSLGT